jgi:hypothetical protein
MNLSWSPATDGSTTTRNHCQFNWTDKAGVRTLEVRPQHCDLCIGLVLRQSMEQGLRVRVARQRSGVPLKAQNGPSSSSVH